MSLFARITELETLEQGWQRVRRNAGSAGGDGMTVDDYADGVALRLMRLQRDLRLGTYVPGPMRELDVPKRSGGTRRLAIPCVNDRVAQTAAAQVLGPLLEREMEDASFGYRPGRSVRMAVSRIAQHRRNGYTWVVDGDIERYFDSVPHERLLDRLARSVDDAQVVDLVALWLEAYAHDDRGLPQGSPISPLLSNLYLDDIDERIQGRGVRLVRFADDFVLLCRSETAAAEARGRMAALLDEHGLRLHPDKTRVVPFEQGFRFLGHLFVHSLIMQELAEDEAAPPADAAGLAALLAERAERADETDGAAGGDAAADLAPGLRVLYVTEPGRRLALRNQAFTVEEDGAELIAVPDRRVDRIELGPHCTVSAAALRHAAGSRTELALVNGWGETVARLEPAGATRRADLQLDQARHVLDAGLRVGLARRLVDGRIRNQRALLRRLNRRRKDPAVDKAVLVLNKAIRKLPVAGDVPTLMGHEGEAAAAYWPALGLTLEGDWRLDRRRRRPPPDPVNLALSFLASLLARDVGAFVARHGLHPGFGVLHESRDGVPACVSDLIEAFRAPLVEGLVVYLLNNRILKRDMFQQHDDGTCRVLPDGRKALVRGYEGWLDRPVRNPATGRRAVWRGVIDSQVGAFAAHVRGDGDYRPYIMDY